jgi:TLD
MQVSEKHALKLSKPRVKRFVRCRFGPQVGHPPTIHFCRQTLDSSVVLAHTADATVLRTFLSKLRTEWLPKPWFRRRKQVSTLLYRGTRDGMTPAVFHDKCDRKGPTLVLVAGQSEGQPVCVFGGYATAAWQSGPLAGPALPVDARGSFVFTVMNGVGEGPVKLAADETTVYGGYVLMCHAGLGPQFCIGLQSPFALCNLAMSSTAPFDEASTCDPSFTMRHPGTTSTPFVVIDIEVWSVV